MAKKKKKAEPNYYDLIDKIVKEKGMCFVVERLRTIAEANREHSEQDVGHWDNVLSGLDDVIIEGEDC